jgi:hypothetical protein
MTTEKRPNIYWIIVDSLRTYKTGLDDRDRIDIVDELAADAVEFTNCVTGAPSSLLSAGAMFTGLPATFVARHFNEWKFTGMDISTITTLHQKYNYNCYPILDTRDLREILHQLLPPLTHKSLPKGYKLSDYVWHNVDVTRIFKHYLAKAAPDQNHAYILWYDCRRDSKTNDHVKEAIDAIKQKGDFDDSLIILHSDHGYPDPRTKLDEKYFRDIGHDMMLTDDNIKVPLVIKRPNGPRGVIKEHQVGLVDVLPTIFDALDIEYSKLNTSFQGQSLMPIIEGKEDDYRVRKTDTRLPMDVKRIGCLRNNHAKYIYLYNDDIELLYDIEKDPQELKNCIDSPEYKSIVESFRKINVKYEEELFLFHDQQVNENLMNSISQIRKQLKSNPAKIVIVTKGIELLIDLLAKRLEQDFGNPQIQLISFGGKNLLVSGIENNHFVDNLDSQTVKDLVIDNLDLTLFLTENSSRVFLKKEQVDAVKSLGAKKSFLMNYNFELFNYFSSKWLNAAYIRLFFDWETKGYFYKQEPLYFIKDFSVFSKYVFIKFRNSLSKKKADIDLKAAREAIHYRNSILQTNTSENYDDMDVVELEYEIERLNTREE